MNYKKIEKEIKKAIDNLDGIKMSNNLKAEAIMEAIKPLLVVENVNVGFNRPILNLNRGSRGSNQT